jgi:hypothetical protein
MLRVAKKRGMEVVVALEQIVKTDLVEVTR